MVEMTQPGRHEALERLDVFVGEWILEASFPGADVRSVFEWALDGRFLMQRTEVRLPGVPDSVAIVAADPGRGEYTQHYFDARGTVRLYAMSFAEGTWKLLRDSPDFSPLDFSQRFTAAFSDDGNTIRGAWEKSAGGLSWEHDFDLTYRRAR
jgi:hypothetical protein